jgi:hypothetical protein
MTDIFKALGIPKIDSNSLRQLNTAALNFTGNLNLEKLIILRDFVSLHKDRYKHLPSANYNHINTLVNQLENLKNPGKMMDIF